MKRATFSLIGAAALAVGARAETPVRHLDAALADALLGRCLAQSQPNAWPPFSIALVDAGGTLVLLRRQDGASAVTVDAALLKARTAARAGAPTQALLAMTRDAPTRDLLLLLQLTDDPGGVPLKSGGAVLGAIGVSGGTAQQDVGCAAAAIAQLTGDTK